MQSFRTLKGIGDMEEKLRTATSILRHDLQFVYFRPNKKISDPKFFFNGPPTEGYLRIYQGTPIVPSLGNPNANNIYEGTDGDGFPSATCTDMAIAFTKKEPGNTRESYMTA